MRRKALLASAMVILGAGAWLDHWSLEGVTGLLMNAVLSHDTEYAAQYTDRAFRSVSVGMSETDVKRSLGPPLGIVWIYHVSGQTSCNSVYFENEAVVTWSSDLCEAVGVRRHMSVVEASRRLPQPEGISWIYSRSPHKTNYKERVVTFEKGVVIKKYTGWWID